ncbi:hypothetical protein LTR41_009595 [Exophiala xenobiotica]|nr:hypothetical protein LTR41_009595 [Exophiala xenobiotica]
MSNEYEAATLVSESKMFPSTIVSLAQQLDPGTPYLQDLTCKLRIDDCPCCNGTALLRRLRYGILTELFEMTRSPSFIVSGVMKRRRILGTLLHGGRLQSLDLQAAVEDLLSTVPHALDGVEVDWQEFCDNARVDFLTPVHHGLDLFDVSTEQDGHGRSSLCQSDGSPSWDRS